MTAIPPVPSQCPVDGCDLAADVILRSSDNKRFKAHSANLGSFSLGFPAAGSTITSNGVDVSNDVLLSESSAVLELLLKFMHPNFPQPDVTQLEMGTLEKLAEAVEKYQVYPAMQVCKVVMTNMLEQHPVTVLKYASRHGYKKLGEAAILYTLDIPLVEMYGEMKDVDPRFFGYWALYRERMNLQIRNAWTSSIRNQSQSVHLNPNGYQSQCGSWSTFHSSLISFLNSRNFKPAFICFDQAIQWEKYRLAGCSHCNNWSEPNSPPATWIQSINSHRQKLFEEVFGEEA